MTNGNGSPAVDARSVDARVDQMGVVFTSLRDKVQIINDLIAGLLAVDETEITHLFTQMDELQKSIAASASVRQQATAEIIELKAKLSAAQDEVDDIESNLSLDVYAATNGDGKPKYTNEKQRQAALVSLRSSDETYVAAKAHLATLDRDKALLAAQLEEVSNKDKADRIIYGGLIARLNNLTARIHLNGKEN